MAGTARWRWICGERIVILRDWCHRLSATGTESPLVFLINFMMPFFGRRQAFVVVAVVTHICKLLFVDRPGEERIATASLDLTHQLLFTAHCQQDHGNVLGRLFCFNDRHCVDLIRSRHFATHQYQVRKQCDGLLYSLLAVLVFPLLSFTDLKNLIRYSSAAFFD